MKVVILSLLATALWPLAANIDDPCAGDPTCTVESGTSGFNITVEEHTGGGGDPGGVSSGNWPVDPTNLVGDGLDAQCVVAAIERGLDPIDFCGLETEDGEPPGITPGMVLVAFAATRPPAAKLNIQPPNGRTLVNFETNFYAEAVPYERTTRLLGHTVELRIRPVRFTWHYGDGATETTATPGAAYPDLQITHTYLRKGTVGPSVDTTYAATYRVDGTDPWLDVDGTVTVTGAPQDLEVLTATPVLVGYDG